VGGRKSRSRRGESTLVETEKKYVGERSLHQILKGALPGNGGKNLVMGGLYKDTPD